MTAQGPSRRMRVLFSVAFLGTHVVIAMALLQVSPLLALGSLLVTTVGLTVLVLRTRAVPEPEPTGRTCDCCTSTVFDPVTVLDEKAPGWPSSRPCGSPCWAAGRSGPRSSG